MESLALTVAGIVLWLLGVGPLGLLLGWNKFPAAGMILGALSAISGLAFLVSVPTAPLWMGLWATLTGVYAVHIGMMTFLRTRE